MQVTTKQVDYRNPNDSRDLKAMLGEYARYETGEDPPNLDSLPNKLAAFPTSFSVLARADDEQGKPIGLMNCFYGFSTFQGRKLVNVHDVIVTQEFRGMGVASNMMDKVREIATLNDCCRLTLEVYANNTSAIRAYQKYGFSRDPAHPNTDIWFLRLPLDS